MLLAILVIIGVLTAPRLTLACLLFHFEQYTLSILLFMFVAYRFAYYTESFYNK